MFCMFVLTVYYFVVLMVYYFFLFEFMGYGLGPNRGLLLMLLVLTLPR